MLRSTLHPAASSINLPPLPLRCPPDTPSLASGKLCSSGTRNAVGSPSLRQKVTCFSTQDPISFLLLQELTFVDAYYPVCTIAPPLCPDPRRTLPTLISPKDPGTADSVASPRDRALVREAGRSIVYISSVAPGKIAS